jgi:prephenate dehydrogenase
MSDASAAVPFARIGIVGLGLIGGSIARGARRAWPRVSIRGVDRQGVVDDACRRGAIDGGGTAITDLLGVDLLVLATPVPDIVAGIHLAARAGPWAAVTDVGSTKRQILAAAESAGLSTFVGGHPIAGAERGGADEARADLFEGRPWVLVPGSAVDASIIARVDALVRGLGGFPRRLDAETHDRVMAYVSHVPQLLASALMLVAGDAVGDAGLAASGRGFADMTRLASSSADVWHGILTSNADFIAEALSAVAAALPATATDLADTARVDRLLAQAGRWRQRCAEVLARPGR